MKIKQVSNFTFTDWLGIALLLAANLGLIMIRHLSIGPVLGSMVLLLCILLGRVFVHEAYGYEKGVNSASHIGKETRKLVQIIIWERVAAKLAVWWETVFVAYMVMIPDRGTSHDIVSNFLAITTVILFSFMIGGIINWVLFFLRLRRMYGGN